MNTDSHRFSISGNPRQFGVWDLDGITGSTGGELPAKGESEKGPKAQNSGHET